MPDTVSGSHVKIKNLGNGDILVTDLNSSNGTVVYNGDSSIKKGNMDEWLKAKTPASFNNENRLSIYLVKEAVVLSTLQRDGSIFLDMQAITGRIEGPFVKPGEELIIGRDTINKMPGTVSASHVKIKNLSNRVIVLTDLNSSNGTYVLNN